MNNYSTPMAINLQDKKHRTEAIMITAGFAVFAIILMILLKWPLPKFEQITEQTGIEVELNLPPDPPEPIEEGGGGGGNPVQAAGDPGIAPPSPPAPGEEEDSKDVEEDEDAAVVKPVAVKPKATTVTNTSVAKVEKPVVTTPAPPRPKAVLGKTTTGAGRGGGAEDYDRAGGSGTGSGVGNGSGTGGGNGTGNGGGNGSGNGGGSGVKKVSGNRYVPSPKGMEAGENINGRVRAIIRVTPEGVGTLVQTTTGSLATSAQAKEIIRDWLRKNRFNTSSETSLVEYEFNIRMN